MLKITKIFICIIACLSMAFPVSIANAEECKLIDQRTVICAKSTQEVMPTAQEVCSGLPYHDMRARGWGTVHNPDGTYYITSGPCWQCVNCYTVMVTQGDIWYGQMQSIGKYAVVHWREPITNTGCVIQRAEYYGQTSANSLNGYRFRAN